MNNKMIQVAKPVEINSDRGNIKFMLREVGKVIHHEKQYREATCDH